MIVTCPSCSARYKINESKVKGRGAKITCPRCAHRFVFYREGDEEAKSAADPVANLDFRTVGLQWRVKSNNVALEFTTLATLRGWLAEGKVSPSDPISFNSRKWTPIQDIKDISAFFADVHRKASRGEISLYDDSFGESEADEPEDDSDAPTTIVGRGSALATEIQDLVRDLATPAPAHSRVDRPTEPPSDPSDDDEAEAAEMSPEEMDEPSVPLYAIKGNSGPPAPSPIATLPAGRGEDTPAPLSAPQARPAPAPAPAPAVVAAPAPAAPGMAMWVVGGVVLVALVGAGLWFGGVFNGGHAPPPDAAGWLAPAP
jgi:predicted Zn finger-like uncharacterized protein